PAAWSAVTLRDLETGSVAFAYPNVRPAADAPLAAWIVAMRAVRPVRNGPHVDSDGNILIQQFLVEHASGSSWWDYVRRRILVPAGMRATGFDGGKSRENAIPYDRSRRVLLRDDAATPDRSDGIRSTVGDFFRYSRALDDRRLLSRTSLAEMTS